MLGASFDDIPAFDQPQRLELSVDGAPVHVFELEPCRDRKAADTAGPNRRALDADWQVRFQAKAGPRTVALTFLNRTPALLENLLEPFEKPSRRTERYYTTRRAPTFDSVEISGPYDASGAGQTRRAASGSSSAGRRAPTMPAQGPDRKPACAKTILSTLARRAFRRPVTDADIQTLLVVYKDGRAAGGFELGIERAVEGCW